MNTKACDAWKSSNGVRVKREDIFVRIRKALATHRFRKSELFSVESFFKCVFKFKNHVAVSYAMRLYVDGYTNVSIFSIEQSVLT